MNGLQGLTLFRRFNVQSMLLHTARPPCPEFGYTSGASEDQAITPGVRATFNVL